jgi:hypothetical protein
MISPVNPYPLAVSFKDNGNAALDFLNLALVIKTSNNLPQALREFISTFNPHKLYLNIQNLDTRQAQSFISTYV